jgi:hypothetical protein
MPLDDPFQLSSSKPVQASAASNCAVRDILPGPLSSAHADQVEHRLYQAAIGIELTQTVDSPAGLTVTRSERAPDVKAALAVLSTLKPGTWRDDRPVTAIQFVIHAPSVSTSSQAWLEQYGPGQGGRTVEGTATTVQLLAGQAGAVKAEGSGPVPDPLTVLTRLSDST